MKRVDRLRRELLAACDLMERWTTPQGAIYTRKEIRRWRRMAGPPRPRGRKREMDAEVRADLADIRRRRRGIPTEFERLRAVAERQIEAWNAAHPVGTEVWVTLDDQRDLRTRTRSVAWLVSGHASILVEGITGGYSLERVRPTARASMDALLRAGSPAR